MKSEIPGVEVGRIVVRYDPACQVYECECRYEDRWVPKEARFWFDPGRKLWVTESVWCAGKLLRYADPGARTMILAAQGGRYGNPRPVTRHGR